MLSILKIVWLLLCISLTVVYTATYNSTSHRDNDIVLFVFLIFLTLPISILTFWLVVSVAYFADLLFHVDVIPPGRWGMVLFGAVFVLAGWLQWNYLFPRFVSRFRRWRSERRTWTMWQDSEK